tara:strand:+ start:104 stop:442 length:339 start_codon:yes stop_codon:yes gene_type:complete
MLSVFLIVKDAYGIDKCARIQKTLNYQILQIFKKIKSLEDCIKPASRYRLKSCIKRKQEGSKGFNCFPELSKAFNSNKKKDCKIRLHKMERSLKNLASLEENNPICQKIEKK